MIQFHEASHTYTLDGVDLPSVTHICRFLAYDYKSDKPWLAEAAARRGTAVQRLSAVFEGLPAGLGADRAPYGNFGAWLRRDSGPVWNPL